MASSKVPATSNRAVGMPWRRMNSLEKILLPSRRAAALVGPMMASPAFSNSSTIAGHQGRFRTDDGKVGVQLFRQRHDGLRSAQGRRE